jgi:hypothetical protein
VGEMTGLLPRLTKRRDYFDYFDGQSIQAAEELVERRLGRGLVKTYMLETTGSDGRAPDLPSVLQRLGLEVRPVDEELAVVGAAQYGGDVALLETSERRHPVLYTLLDASQSDPWVQRLVSSTPWLDRLWLSAGMFHALWGYVQRAAGPRRYTKLGFEYEGRFEAGELEDLEATSPDEPTEDIEEYRRSSRFTIVDRVGIVARTLPRLEETYRPLSSMTQLRIPSAHRGGHDFYHDGKVTNRSNSFDDHQQTVKFVVRLYRRVTEVAEETMLLRTETAVDDEVRLPGAPLYVEFSEPLESASYEAWVNSTFSSRGNEFRLAGHPFRLSPEKVHVYGIDRHLWQPVSLELTPAYAFAFLPAGTCGNTVHRFITNVQRYLNPDVRAWIGDSSYEDVVNRALEQAIGSA